MLGAADRMGRVGGDDLAGDQPVEQLADRSEVLLDRRLLEGFAERFDVVRNVERFDLGELADLVTITPGEKPVGRMKVSRAGVFVGDIRREEFEEATGGCSPASATIKGSTISVISTATAREGPRTVNWRLGSGRVATTGSTITGALGRDTPERL
jgi:hypothetical protein